MLCLWKEQTDNAVWYGYSAVLCVLNILVLGVEFVTVSNIVFIEGTDRQCSVAWLVCIV